MTRLQSPSSTPLSFTALASRSVWQRGLSIGMCKLLLLSSTVGFVLLAGERGTIAAFP